MTLVCFTPITFLALSGAGVIGTGNDLSAVQRAVCVAGLALLGFSAFVEYDNGTPWHKLRHPRVLKGLRIGPTLLENTVRFVVYAAVTALPMWKRLPSILLLLAPLTYPTVAQGFHRFQVCIVEGTMLSLVVFTRMSCAEMGMGEARPSQVRVKETEPDG